MTSKLILEDGSVFEGKSFGYQSPSAGEVVFATGMVGYPESLTDPSYFGQILILTYPLIGNYGVPDSSFWESDGIKVSGLIVSRYIETPSHFQSQMTLEEWLKKEKIPALQIADTRLLTQKIRKIGVMLGKIIFGEDIPFYDPNQENLVQKMSGKRLIRHSLRSSDARKILLYDCGAKKGIERSLLERDVNLTTVPWDFDPFKDKLRFEAVVISNGPGDPASADKTIKIVRKFMAQKIPVLGICLGHQILALASGGTRYKLKFGHRSQNQPCLMVGTKRCFITSQNHGFAVGKIPLGFKLWFSNANDGSNEGIIHESQPFMSVQFHPEASPGPKDTEWIFDYFLSRI